MRVHQSKNNFMYSTTNNILNLYHLRTIFPTSFDNLFLYNTSLSIEKGRKV